MYLAEPSDATLTGCAFESNAATEDFQCGGALYASFGSVVELHGCNFTANSVDEGYGGAVYLESDAGSVSTANINTTVFNGNTAGFDGGGLFAGPDSVVTVVGGSLANNVVDNRGGGFYFAPNSTATLTGTLFVANSGFAGGGGFFANSANSNVTSCTFVDNAQTNNNKYGGAIAYNPLSGINVVRGSSFHVSIRACASVFRCLC